jgi:hypothetical protein
MLFLMFAAFLTLVALHRATFVFHEMLSARMSAAGAIALMFAGNMVLTALVMLTTAGPGATKMLGTSTAASKVSAATSAANMAATAAMTAPAMCFDIRAPDSQRAKCPKSQNVLEHGHAPWKG